MSVPEPLTLRQRNAAVFPFLIWLVTTALATVAGPFGTFGALTFWPRLGYWAVVAGVSVAVSCGLLRLVADLSAPVRLLAWCCFVVFNAAVVHLGNTIVFAEWQGWGQFIYLVFIVGLVTVMVHGLIRTIEWQTSRHAPPHAVDPEQQFLRKLPLERRAPLIRIEAQDHYLNVVTEAGSDMILMRLSDALAMLSGVEGLQVHRSHWVRTAAVVKHTRVGARDFLEMRDGTGVPVSRGHKKAARAAGLL